MANAKLVDLSRWNGPADLKTPVASNWTLASEKGIVGAFIRLGSINDITGECYLDDRLFEHVDDAVKANKPIGYYFYSRPKFDGSKQGTFILDTLRYYQLPVDLDIAYDVEAVGLSPAQAAASTKAATMLLAGAYPRRVAIYTRQSFWDPNIAADPFWSTLKLWAARYNTLLTGPWSDGKLTFRDWSNWTIWQYSADGNGLAAAHGWTNGSVSIDLNQYNGDEAAFRKAYNLDPLAELKAQIDALTAKVASYQAEAVAKNSAQDTSIEALKAANEQVKTKVVSLETALNLANGITAATKRAIDELAAWARQDTSYKG